MKMTFLFICLSSLLSASPLLEKECLTNIKQLTFSHMGFEKAGEAYFSPNGEEIIFQAVPFGEDFYQIFTMNISELEPRLVSTGKGACTCGFYRPDGKKIIFASSHESPEPFKKSESCKRYTWDLVPYTNIYEANLDGSNLKKLTHGPSYSAECGYSRDGSSIVFASNRDSSMNVYTINADGSNIKQLTHTKNCYNGGTFFSPDGSHIIFRADRQKPHFLHLYVMTSEGNNLRQLTFGDTVNWAPFWHPQGSVIAYTTSKHGHKAYEIYLLNVITGKEYRLTHSDCFDGLPSFSYDGKKILWTSKRGLDNCQVFIADFKMPESIFQ